MQQTPFQLLRSTTLALLAILSLITCAEIHANSLEVRAVYEGSGQVDENHGLLLFVFSDDDFSNPANPIIATRYLTNNKATARFDDLDVQEVWLMAVYDEKGGYSSGPLPGPFGLYSTTPDGAPTGVKVGDSSVELRFDDSQRVPAPPETKPTASFDTLLAADGGIVEIRTYQVKPGRRDEFVRFFEDTLEAQAAVGLRVVGHFRSLDDENTFVWIRAFRNQKERQEQSRAFYFGPTWLEERRAEAAKYLADGEVILLEPAARSGIR